MTSKIFAAGASIAVLAMASSAFAQAPAAAPAAPPITSGPAIPGLCVVDLDQVVANSTVGKYVSTRLQQISAQVNAELGGEKTQIDNDAKALDGQRASLDENTFQQRGLALQQRANGLQRKLQVRERELQVTEQKAVGRVIQESEPLMRQAYQAKNCSILLQHGAVLGGFFNQAMDLTPAVTTALNGKITQFAFDRERLDQPGANTAPGGAPPIVQTPGPARPAAPAAAKPAPKK
ncbi:MAG: OmpH family outer membrane protein [Proteobacteria bacterium]|nr:OmpH family outer membrane protein [Pseudomonadota bacterium]